MENRRVRRDFLQWQKVEVPSIPAAYWSVSHPAQASRPVGTKSPAGAQLGLGCWHTSSPGTEMLPSTSAAGGSLFCSWEQAGCGMPDSFTSLYHLPAASRTFGDISGEGCHASCPPSWPAATISGAPCLLIFPLAA